MAHESHCVTWEIPISGKQIFRLLHPQFKKERSFIGEQTNLRSLALVDSFEKKKIKTSVSWGIPREINLKAILSTTTFKRCTVMDLKFPLESFSTRSQNRIRYLFTN